MKILFLPDVAHINDIPPLGSPIFSWSNLWT